MEIVNEFRGVDSLVYAEVLVDTADMYITGPVKKLAPVAEISKTTDGAGETRWYNNLQAFELVSEGADVITLTTAVIDEEDVAAITGQQYDAETGALMDGMPRTRYFALGYRMKLIGDKPGYRYVWRYKGIFQPVDENSTTESNNADGNGQSVAYVGILTNYKFAVPNDRQRALVVDDSDGLADVTTFFDQVTTIDTLTRYLTCQVLDEQAYFSVSDGIADDVTFAVDEDTGMLLVTISDELAESLNFAVNEELGMLEVQKIWE